LRISRIVISPIKVLKRDAKERKSYLDLLTKGNGH